MDISGKRMYGLLEKLDFVRLSTFEGETKGAEIIADEIRALGGDAVIETFKAPRYEIKKVKLEVIEPFYKEYEVTGFGFSGNAAADGLEADFVYLEALEPMDLEMAKGKIALIAGGLRTDSFKILIEAGVLGFIATNGTFRETRETLDLEEKMLRPMHIEHGKLPGVSIRMTDALEMVAAKPKRVRLTLAQDEGEADSRNVVAEIKGTERPDEIVVFTAHYDTVIFSHGMFDNASGTATILELYRHFLANPPKRTLRFIWCGSEERGLLGSKAYIAAHESELEKIRLCVNVDMTGPLLGRDEARIIGEESICHVLSFFHKEIGYPMNVKQDLYSSDGIPFSDKGIPSINFMRLSAPGTAQIHCRYDTIALVTAESMERTARFIASFCEHIINAAYFPIDRKIPDNMVDRLNSYLRKKK